MDWELIRHEYETTDLTLKAIAEKFGIKLGTLKSRKSRESWTRDATFKKDATKNKKVATTKKDATFKPVIESKDLNDKQKLFCLYYIKYYNATKSYQKAYGCAYTTAMVNGSGLLRNTKVAAEINRLKAEQQQGVFLDGMAVLQKYIDIAFADITDFVQFGKKEVPKFNMITGEPVLNDLGDQVVDTYNFVDVMNAPEVDGTIITEIKHGKEGISIKLADKMKALEMLTKYLDLIPDHHKRKLEEEQAKLNRMKYELDKRVVELREREEKTKGW
ncbi:terminase small subunit [Bacillus sp. ISL-40]|uniref:terminase small subunit n=1 Tax=unclassified Bacillus (in: firmicutes) TaxID=185979 RepID=UPI001BE8BCCF|nr:MULTISPECIES: terminase small subunit [unclassified Bacillus (in: firmicutes)]MBT2696357.1 terminase small subunit [Bacillus sp. ISL-40]MBT2743206.1 terminase small subunit [Bacillus sp. ISL-77]